VNGIHDMGGMHGMGPIQSEKNEPVFHAPWEGRVFALRRAMGAWRKWNIDSTRHEIELVPPAEYLRMSYYERQLGAFIDLMVKRELITRAEAETGKPAPDAGKVNPALTVEGALALVAKGVSTKRAVAVNARFKAGEKVRVRNMHPVGHTRLPRYARGKTGTIDRDHGVFVFPDTNAHFLGEKPQHVYSVRFAARELWGEQAAPRDSVYVDMWDDYLEPA
jgi:nitrile hydratase subunit beta